MLCEDCAFDKSYMQARPLFYRESPLFAARIIELSQGGCQLVLTGGSVRFFERHAQNKLMYIQTSLSWGKLDSAIKVLAQIRGFKQFQHKVILNCAFLDKLPRIPEKVKYSHYDYKFRLKEPATIRINNRDYFKVNRSFHKVAPY